MSNTWSRLQVEGVKMENPLHLLMFYTEMSFWTVGFFELLRSRQEQYSGL